MRQRGHGRIEAWPRSLLQALRAGRQRLADPATRLTGASYPRIRTALNQLSAERRQRLRTVLRVGVGFDEGARTIDAATATHWQPVALQRALPRQGQALLLELAGRDRFGRRHWLQPAAQRAWQQMRHAAHLDGVELELISSFRSERDQLRILLRKLVAGQNWDQILAVNAPPGFSEHHTGCAIDLAVPGEPVLTEAFELTDAFRWLQANAGRYGYALSYPRNHVSGFIYEPWHWCYHPTAERRALSLAS